MYGKGRPGPTASGVSTGKICSAKMRSIASSSSGLHRSQSITRMSCSASAGRSSSSQTREWRAPSSRVRSPILSSVSLGDRPSAPRASMPASTWSRRPATRTMMNSSWFEA